MRYACNENIIRAGISAPPCVGFLVSGKRPRASVIMEPTSAHPTPAHAPAARDGPPPSLRPLQDKTILSTSFPSSSSRDHTCT